VLLQQENAASWAQKLKPFDELNETRCCKRQCVNKGIPRPVLEGTRAQFKDLGTQVERKRALSKFLDTNSQTSFSFCYGQFVVCWKAMSLVTGVSTTLMQSITGSAKARFENVLLFSDGWCKCLHILLGVNCVTFAGIRRALNDHVALGAHSMG
jgi:hypothetical protein